MNVGLQLAAVRVWINHLCVPAGPPSKESRHAVLAEWSLDLRCDAHCPLPRAWGGFTPMWLKAWVSASPLPS